jgi:hypothetical protein
MSTPLPAGLIGRSLQPGKIYDIPETEWSVCRQQDWLNVYDEEGDHRLTLPIDFHADDLKPLVLAYEQAFKKGVDVGEASMATKLRRLIGAAPLL